MGDFLEFLLHSTKIVGKFFVESEVIKSHGT